MVVPVSVAENVGVCPETGLLFTSFKVIVIVDAAVPSATTGVVPAIVEVAAIADPAVNVTVPSALLMGPVIERVLTSALSEESVQVEIPEASVAEQTPALLVVPVSVAENVGVIPTTELLLASFSVIVTAEIAIPSATTGPVPVMVEFATDAPADVKTTIVPDLTTGVAIARVLDSA